jgi:hypothetical protein
MSEVHWIVRATLAVSFILSLMSVYYATTQHRLIGRLLQAKQVRGWIRGRLPAQTVPFGSEGHQLKKRRRFCPDPAKFVPTNPTDDNDTLEELTRQCFTPSVASVVTLSSPQIPLLGSLICLFFALGTYFGWLWSKHTEKDAGHNGARKVFILYIVSIFTSFVVYFLSRLIQDDDSRGEWAIICGNAQNYIDAHPDVVHQWKSAGDVKAIVGRVDV